MLVGGRCVGGLVFGRFGGPSFPPEHIRLAEFVAWHVGQLLENRRLAHRIATLEAQRELARMQDEFISTISHELRTPLGFIKGYVTTLLREDVDWNQETRAEFLRIVDDESDRLRELIDNLLDSSRLESGRLGMNCEPTRVSALIRDTSERTKSAYPDMDLRMEIAENLSPVDIDATRISQVFDNLLSNASKYAPESTVRVKAMNRGDHIRLEVIDNGPGIHSDHIPHLFERFYRVPGNTSTVRGTGLGLYICRKIVEAHGGEIGVETEPDKGSIFYFTLPTVSVISEQIPEKQYEPE
jgi:signal transduction histidine kinase